MHDSVLTAEKTLNHALFFPRINFLKQMSSLLVAGLLRLPSDGSNICIEYSFVCICT